MAENKIDLTIDFDTSGAIKDVKTFGNAASSSIDKINEKVKTFGTSIGKVSKAKISIDTSAASSALGSLTSAVKTFGAAAAAYFSIRAVKGFFDEMIEQSNGTADGLNNLSGAMARSGEYSEKAMQNMKEYANALTQVSVVDDDVIYAQLALARNFTTSNEQAQKLVKAATDLSAATGISLDSAVQQLSKTLGGFGGELGEKIPQLRSLSKEALQSGAAIDLVAKKFGGAAANELQTFSGAIAQAKNFIGNFMGALGDAITQSPVVAQLILEIGNAFNIFGSNVNDSNQSLMNFVNRGIVSIISGMRDLLPTLSTLNYWLKAILQVMNHLYRSALLIVDGFKILGNAFTWLVGTTDGKKKSLENINEAFEEMIKNSDSLADGWDKLGKTSFDDIDTSAFDEALKRIQEAANKKPPTIKPKFSDADKIEPIEVDAKLKPELKDEVQKPTKYAEFTDIVSGLDFWGLLQTEFENFIKSFSNLWDKHISSRILIIGRAAGLVLIKRPILFPSKSASRGDIPRNGIGSASAQGLRTSY